MIEKTQRFKCLSAFYFQKANSLVYRHFIGYTGTIPGLVILLITVTRNF